MIKDLGGTVHLSQDDDHLVVYELFELPQVTNHLHLQLCSDLRNTIRQFRETAGTLTRTEEDCSGNI